MHVVGIVGYMQPRPDPESTGLVQNASSTAHAASTSVGADTVLAPGVAELKVQASWIQISNLSVMLGAPNHDLQDARPNTQAKQV